MTIRDYFEDGDAYALDQIKQEYDHLVTMVFEQYSLRDTQRSNRRSIMDVTRQISEYQTRMRDIDLSRHVIANTPNTEQAYGDIYIIRNKRHGKQGRKKV